LTLIKLVSRRSDSMLKQTYYMLERLVRSLVLVDLVTTVIIQRIELISRFKKKKKLK